MPAGYRRQVIIIRTPHIRIPCGYCHLTFPSNAQKRQHKQDKKYYCKVCRCCTSNWQRHVGKEMHTTCPFSGVLCRGTVFRNNGEFLGHWDRKHAQVWSGCYDLRFWLLLSLYYCNVGVGGILMLSSTRWMRMGGLYQPYCTTDVTLLGCDTNATLFRDAIVLCTLSIASKFQTGVPATRL